MPVSVSFVVPCYRLAHLLGECLASLLGQSFEDFEIVVMDDCSPDDTAAVAGSFRDPRIRYVRNAVNLGHLGNYNRGIALARGGFVWLVSADDRLRSPHALARFVDVLRNDPKVGFVFCPAIAFDESGEGSPTVTHGERDRIYRNGDFLRRLLQSNCVPASAGLVRRECYERIGSFPLDLPFAGDWYVWSALALHDDVAYVAEPLVGYRVHALNMTKTCMRDLDAIVDEGIAVRWRIAAMIGDSPQRHLASDARRAMGWFYGSLLTGSARVHGVPVALGEQRFEASLERHCRDPRERAGVRARAFAAAGDERYDAGHWQQATQWYARALREDRAHPRTWAKYLLVRGGALGRTTRKALVRLEGR